MYLYVACFVAELRLACDKIRDTYAVSLCERPRPKGTRNNRDDTDPLDHNQRAILVAAASLAAGRQFGKSERTEAFDRLKTHGDARVFLSAIKAGQGTR